jgi:hypothetical protein
VCVSRDVCVHHQRSLLALAPQLKLDTRGLFEMELTLLHTLQFNVLVTTAREFVAAFVQELARHVREAAAAATTTGTGEDDDGGGSGGAADDGARGGGGGGVGDDPSFCLDSLALEEAVLSLEATAIALLPLVESEAGLNLTFRQSEKALACTALALPSVLAAFGAQTSSTSSSSWLSPSSAVGSSRLPPLFGLAAVDPAAAAPAARDRAQQIKAAEHVLTSGWASLLKFTCDSAGTSKERVGEAIELMRSLHRSAVVTAAANAAAANASAVAIASAATEAAAMSSLSSPSSCGGASTTGTRDSTSEEVKGRSAGATTAGDGPLALPAAAAATASASPTVIEQEPSSTQPSTALPETPARPVGSSSLGMGEAEDAAASLGSDTEDLESSVQPSSAAVPFVLPVQDAASVGEAIAVSEASPVDSAADLGFGCLRPTISEIAKHGDLQSPSSSVSASAGATIEETHEAEARSSKRRRTSRRVTLDRSEPQAPLPVVILR